MRSLTGRTGGLLMEAIAALDIALWDLRGKAVGLPIHRLLAGMGRDRLTAYASCPPKPTEDDTIAYLHQAVERGYRMLKLVFNGQPVRDVLSFCRRAREDLPVDIRLCADANTSYGLDDAILIAKGLSDLDFFWFEEPLIAGDCEGYAKLRAAVPIRIAAGQSEFTALGARNLIATRSVSVLQPACVRSS